MVSVLHEALIEVLRDHPHVLVGLLGGVQAGVVPAHDHVENVRADLGSALPRELRADSSLRFERNGAAVLTLVLEVQLAIDPDKLFVWPAYLTSVRLRDRCPALLVVITVDRIVATWARKPIELGPGVTIQPLVIGPDEIAPILDLDEARREPERAVISALAHARDADEARSVQVAATAIQAALGLPGDRGVGYYDLILASLGEGPRRALEMLIGNYQLQDEGLRKAWAGGKNEGKAEGKAEGEAKGKAEGVLAVLGARGLSVSSAERARILGSADIVELDRWLRAAVTAANTEDIFEPA